MPAELWVIAPSTGQWVRATNSGQVVVDPLPTFVHPGVMYSEAQLDQMAADVTATGSNPRKTSYTTMLSRTSPTGTNAGMAFSSLSWTPHPVATLSRYASTSWPSTDVDCIQDSIAALVHALIWRLTGARASASKAAQILNAWSGVVTRISQGWPESSTVSSGGMLSGGWTCSLICRAAEILCYSGYTAGAGETALDVDRLKNKIRTVWLPVLRPVEPIGQHNWHSAVIDGVMQAAVFLDDMPLFDTALGWWRQEVPSFFWMPGDTNQIPAMAASTPPASGLPIVPEFSRYNVPTVTRASILSYWQNPTSWPAGLSGELGRDFHHNAMIFAQVGNAAETAYHQGVDLWAEQQDRITTATELFADVLADIYVSGGNPSTWPFTKTPTAGSSTTSAQRATFETIYMNYAVRKGVSMPRTLALLNGYVRPSTFIIDTGPGCIFCEGMTFRDNPGV